MLNGIDFFSGNGNPSITGLDFVFRKATEGLNYNDADNGSKVFGYTRNRVKNAGLIFGSYHFFWGDEDWKAQADHYIKYANPQPGEMIALDYEHGKNTAAKDSWIKYIKGKFPKNRVGLYCNIDYWHSTNDYCGDFLWIADPTTAGKPRIQAKWLFHQYSTAGGIDHDKGNFANRLALKNWANFVTTPPIAPKPVPKPASKTNDEIYAAIAAMQKDLNAIKAKLGVQ